MKNKGFIKLYRSVLSRPELTDLLTEEGGTGFGTYMMILLYLSQCDDLEGLYTNAQLSALASQARKSRAYINHIICDFGLFEIEGKRFRDSFMIEYSPARTKRFAGEEIEKEIEKENKEKPGGVCQKDTRPEPTTPQPLKTGTYRRVCNHCKWLHYVKPSRERRILRELEERKNARKPLFSSSENAVFASENVVSTSENAVFRGKDPLLVPP